MEGKIAAAQVEACQASGLEGLGYDAIVWLSSAAALNIERFPPGQPLPCALCTQAFFLVQAPGVNTAHAFGNTGKSATRYCILLSAERRACVKEPLRSNERALYLRCTIKQSSLLDRV